MPQACDEDRNLMLQWFGHDVSDVGPLRFLKARGWTFPGGLCTPPTPAHQPSQYEMACAIFLCDEWDYAYEGRMNLIAPFRIYGVVRTHD